MVAAPTATVQSIQEWYAASEACLWSTVLWQPSQYKSPPEVVVQDLSQKLVVRVRMVDARDGVHCFINAFPERHQPPLLHLIFRSKSRWTDIERSKMAAGLVAATAMTALKPRLMKRDDGHGKWLRSVYESTRGLTKGSHPGSHLVPALIHALDFCEKRFESEARLDVGEAWERVKGDFQVLLSNGASEEDIVRAFREIQADQVFRE